MGAEKYLNTENTEEKLKEQIYLDNAKVNSTVDSRDIKLKYLYETALRTNDINDTNELKAYIQHMKVVDTIFSEFAEKLELEILGETNENIQYECLRNSINYFKYQCGNWDEYTLKYAKYISVACKSYTEDFITKTIDDLC